MVDVMGQTPEEFEEMLNAQIAEGERKAAALDEFLATLESARVTGFDSRREVEVEVNQEGTMTRVSIDDDALEGSASDLEEAIMEAYSDAGKSAPPRPRQRAARAPPGGGGPPASSAAAIQRWSRSSTGLAHTSSSLGADRHGLRSRD